jgi:hypothetical protein
MVGRAEQTEGAVSAFWRAMASEVMPKPPEPEPVAEPESAPEQQLPLDVEDDPDTEQDDSTPEAMPPAIEEGRVQGSPAEPPDLAQELRALWLESEQQHQAMLADVRAYVDSRRGRISSDPSEIAGAQRIREHLTKVRGEA